MRSAALIAPANQLPIVVRRTLCLLAVLLLCMAGNIARAQWVPTNGPYGGYIYCFAESGSKIFAGTWGGGVFLSTNSGATWKAVNKGFEGRSVDALAFMGSALFAAMNDGIYVSYNDGINWTLVNRDLRASSIITALIAVDSVLFAAVDGQGVYRSYDSGISWSPVNTGLTTYYFGQFTVFGSDLFVCNWDGIFHLDSTGTYWTQSSTGIPAGAVWHLSSGSTAMFAGTDRNGMYRSLDSGRSWTDINPGLADRNIWDIKSSGTNVYLISGTDNELIYRSADNGTTWTLTDTGFSRAPKQVLGLLGNQLYVGTNGGGVFVSDDSGSNWTERNLGIINSVVLALESNGSDLFAGVMGNGIAISHDDGNTWIRSNTGLPRDTGVASFAFVDSFLFAGTEGAGIYRSSDRGASWTPVNNGSQELPYSTVNCLLRFGNALYAGTNQGLFMSADRGGLWLKLDDPVNLVVYDLKYIDSTLFVANEDGIYRSRDAGLTWEDINSGLTAGYMMTYELGTDGKNLYAGMLTYRDAVFMSRDQGDTWKRIGYGLPGTYIYSLLVQPNGVYAGTMDAGVWYLTDTLGKWYQYNDGIEKAAIFRIRARGDRIFASVPGRGVWKVGQGAGVQGAALNRCESGCRLYPNPMHARARLDWANPASAPCSFRLYDVQGKLLREERDIRTGSITIFRNELLPGTYTYEVRTSTRLIGTGNLQIID